MKTLLSKSDASLLLWVIHSSLSCDTEEHLRDLTNHLKCLFPYEFAVCALLGTQASIDENHFINISFPPEWCSLYVAEGFDRTDPIVRESARNGNGIQYWTDTYRKYDARAFVSCARDFGLEKGYSHGVRAPGGHRRSLFSFAGGSVDKDPRTELILHYVVPHLDRAFQRIVGTGKRKTHRVSAELSSREREILNWVKDGKSTWEISAILSISTNTVQFHL